jgi:hypothetical protein
MTVDDWTSDSNRPFMGKTLHWLDNEFRGYECTSNIVPHMPLKSEESNPLQVWRRRDLQTLHLEMRPESTCWTDVSTFGSSLDISAGSLRYWKSSGFGQLKTAALDEVFIFILFDSVLNWTAGCVCWYD